jgi:hypothetical protein
MRIICISCGGWAHFNGICLTCYSCGIIATPKSAVTDKYPYRCLK